LLVLLDIDDQESHTAPCALVMNNKKNHYGSFFLWFALCIVFSLGTFVRLQGIPLTNKDDMFISGRETSTSRACGPKENDTVIFSVRNDFILAKEFVGDPDPSRVSSKLASVREGSSEWCQSYLKEMNEFPYRTHRKQWEFCWTAFVLDKFGMIDRKRSRGLGFAVGKEPLPSYFVKRGVDLVVTDMPADLTSADAWSQTNQHSSRLMDTFRAGIVDAETYRKKAKFMPVNMNAVPRSLLTGNFDFLWSCGSLEHIGPIQKGRAFIIESLKALRVGGIAVHTTEFALNTLNPLPPLGPDLSVWVKQDVDALEADLKGAGGELIGPVDYRIGTSNLDLSVDKSPYSAWNHFILHYSPAPDVNVVLTSIGFIIRRIH
jgi:hypothetical protein